MQTNHTDGVKYKNKSHTWAVLRAGENVFNITLKSFEW